VATRRSIKMVYVTVFGGTPAACMSASTCFAPGTSPACCTECNACQNGCHEHPAAGCPSHQTYTCWCASNGADFVMIGRHLQTALEQGGVCPGVQLDPRDACRSSPLASLRQLPRTHVRLD
jgi:hypothetical protein